MEFNIYFFFTNIFFSFFLFFSKMRRMKFNYQGNLKNYLFIYLFIYQFIILRSNLPL